MQVFLKAAFNINIPTFTLVIIVLKIILKEIGIKNTVAPRYNAPRYYADSDITRSVVDPEFLPPGENVKWYLELL